MSYLKKRTRDESIKITVELSRVCAELGGPLSQQLFGLLEEGRFQELIDFQIDYSWAFSVDDFIYARQIQGFVAKQDFIDLGVDKESVAFEKFLATELLCRETNNKFENTASLSWDVNGVLYSAQRKIARILGDVPSLDSLRFEFGPGATTSTNSLVASPRAKLSSRLECSINLLPVLGSLLEQLPMLCDIHSTIQDDEAWRVPVSIQAGKLSFVPKDCKTHRSIVVEPILNGLGQKGIGTYMKKRLLSHGLDLTQQDTNQRLARKGSLDNSLATIDLSSASDCVSRGLVWNLLPYDWACLLDMFRSPVVSYKNQEYKLEKFSSMGNAYTFELESLIFYSLALSVCDYLRIDSSNVSVFGDDIIVPVESYNLLTRVLTECGFLLNEKKTFCDGPFRESCGADYMRGVDIRPFYLKTLINDRALYNMHNWFIRSGEVKLAKRVELMTHAPSRLYGPDGYGDGHLIGDWHPRLNRDMKRRGFCGGVFDTYTLKPRERFKDLVLDGDYVYPCYSIYVRGGSEEISEPSEMYRVRGTRGYNKISIYTHALGIFS